MRGYLTKFDNRSDYSTYVGSAYDKPNVSLIAATGEVIFTDYEEPYPGEPMTFADSAVKAICVANWGSDGEITYGQAAAVTTFQVEEFSPSAFMENTTITSFNELQYFTSEGASSYRAFYGCTNLESVTIPAVYQVGPQAFSGCASLASVTILEGLTSIGNNAFEDCTSLTDVTIPSTVINMGGAFKGCTSLETVTVKATTPPGLAQADPFDGCTSLTAIYVPAESVTAYQTDQYWDNYASIIQAIPSA